MGFEIEPLAIPDVLLIKNNSFEDERGFFRETFRESIEVDSFVQENHSRSLPGVIRGLHFQIKPEPTSKLVRCINGRIFDVAVDLRSESDTYKKWVGVYLGGNANESLYIPEGFAHGFYVISVIPADVVYKVSSYYAPDLEKSIRWDDPDININWPIHYEPATLSKKDEDAPLLKEIPKYF